MIPRLLVVFTRHLEIVVTTLMDAHDSKKKKGLETTVLYARAETSKEHIVNVRYSWFNLQVSKGLPMKDCLLLKKRTAVVFALERNTHFGCFAQLTGKPRPDSSPLYPLEILFLLRASPSLSYWSPPRD